MDNGLELAILEWPYPENVLDKYIKTITILTAEKSLCRKEQTAQPENEFMPNDHIIVK